MGRNTKFLMYICIQIGVTLSHSVSAKYIIINQNSSEKTNCSTIFCTQSDQIKDQLISHFSITKRSQKSENEQEKFSIKINSSKVIVTILDQQNDDGFIPLMKVTDSTEDLNLYTL